jgi:hypothetical protein
MRKCSCCGEVIEDDSVSVGSNLTICSCMTGDCPNCKPQPLTDWDIEQEKLEEEDRRVREEVTPEVGGVGA